MSILVYLIKLEHEQIYDLIEARQTNTKTQIINTFNLLKSIKNLIHKHLKSVEKYLKPNT